MSVLFTTYCNQFIVLCADKQITNMNTGKKEKSKTKKIEQWAPFMAVGYTGNAVLGQIILDTVHRFTEQNGICNYSVEDMSDMFCQCFYAVKDEYTALPSGLCVQFMIAGKLANGTLGIGSIYANDDDPDLEIYEGKQYPSTVIFAPEDMTDDECNQLLQKAINNSKHTQHKSPIEILHRQAVQYVSDHSKFVGAESDFIMITKDE